MQPDPTAVTAADGARYPLGYNPRLDGIRALAALCVVFTHFEIPGFSGGLFGVDIFFVLSGYLITRILNNDVQHGRHLGQFYWRRILRLMPALLTVCITLFILSFWYAEKIPVRRDILAATFYVSNWTRAFGLGTPTYLGNTWSLAVEEQFYLIWPFVLMVFSRRGGKRQLLFVAVAMFIATVVWRSILAHEGAGFDRIFNGFDTRCDGILLGAVAALAQSVVIGDRGFRSIARLWPAAIIAIAFLVYGGAWSNATATITNFAALILLLAAEYLPSSMLGTILQFSPLVLIGRISYGLYLWHYPISILLHNHFYSHAETVIIGIPLSFACAYISYRFVEEPMLRLRYISWLHSRRFGLLVAILSVTGMCGASIYFFHSNVMQRYFPQPLVIEDYGPKTLRHGMVFNLQPSGQSCMWIRLSHIAPEADLSVRIADQVLKGNVQGDTVAVLLPRELLDEVGLKSVVMIDSDGKAIAPPVTMEITQ